MANKKGKKKIIKYRRPFNIGIVFFGFVIVYLLVCIYMFVTSKHISGYEVLSGNLSDSKVYTGVAIRQESIYPAESAGNVNYYVSEGEKVAVLSTIYSIDEGGDTGENLEEAGKGYDLKESDYEKLRSGMIEFSEKVDSIKFSEIYKFKKTVEAEVIDLINESRLNQLDEAEKQNSNLFNTYKAKEAGVITYYVDGLEDITTDDIQKEWFDIEAYKKEELQGNKLVGVGDSVYKLITDENWEMVFQLDEDTETYIREKIDKNKTILDDGSEKQNTTYIQIQMEQDKESIWPKVRIEQMGEDTYGILTFNSSMVRYAKSRYLEFQILKEETMGLKIPKSAVVEKEFYEIPKEYLVKVENDNGFMRQTTSGEIGSVFVPCTIYAVTEEYVYIDPLEEEVSTSEKRLKVGDNLIKADSTTNYQVGQMRSLPGVYNINKGYTVFRHIEILYENEEYCIVEEGMSYSISVYDHIVLDGVAVNANEVIYE